MSLLKEIAAHATSAWSPIGTKSNMIAIGSKEGVGVGFENYGGDLQLHSMDFSNTDSSTKVLGKLKINTRFLSMAWSENLKLKTECPLGILAGGMADGSVKFWNPSKIVNGHEETAEIASVERHTGAVNVIQFNPRPDSAHLLASGGSDNDVKVMALDKLGMPQVFSPGAPNAPKHVAEVSSLAWNTQVSYILATGAINGTTMVWDLKQKKPWCELKDPYKGNVSALAWNPEEGLSLITASGDDQRPVIRMWDLRSSTSTPLVELQGHDAGILSLSWCPNDPGLLMSCGKDNKTMLWDLYAGKSIYEFPSNSSAEVEGNGQFFGGAKNGQRRFDVQWAKKIPTVASASTFDGKVQVWGLAGAGTNSTRAPKWSKRPITASFGFGGKLVTVANHKKNQQGMNKVYVHQLVTEPDVVAGAEQMEIALAADNDDKAYCANKVALAVTDHDKSVWSFMGILFEEDARQKLLLHLGFDAETIANEIAKYTGKSTPMPEVTQDGPPPASADDVFGNAPLENTNDEKIVQNTPVVQEDNSKKMDGGPQAVYTENSESFLKRALLVGNFDAAVDCCLRNNQMADALLLSTCGGPELWKRTQDAFFSRQTRPFMKMVSAVIQDDLHSLVDDSNLDNWQETLAMLSTYGKSDAFPALSEKLGNRLELSGDVKAATLCFMCAVSPERTVKAWIRQANIESNVIGSTAATLNLIEKISIFSHALPANNKDMGIEAGRQFSAYAAMLASQGRLDIATRYAIFDDLECAIMRYRLYQACPQPGMAPPPFPFEQTNLQASPQSTYQAQQPAHIPQAQQQYPRNNSISQAANTGYAAPNTGYAAPNTGYAAPSSGYAAPSTSYNAPSTGYTAPNTGYTAPSVPTANYGGQPGAYGQPQQGVTPPSYPQSSGQFSAPSPMHQPSSMPQGNYGAPPVQQQSTGINSLAAATKTSARVSKTPVDMNKQRSDGFVSSVGNKELTHKYGNATTQALSPSMQAPLNPSAQQLPLGCVTSVSQADMPIVHGFNELILQLESAPLGASERRQLSEIQKAKNIMFTRLNANGLSPAVVGKLHEIVSMFKMRDFRSALAIHMQLTTSDWAEHKDWLRGLKALINISTKRL